MLLLEELVVIFGTKKLPPNFKRGVNNMMTLEDIYDMIRDNEKQMEKILKLLEEDKDE
jgi:hypothetical protein